ncbi:MAG: host-nuclease inhibitor Gam family protein [Butyrivibrio sp.]|nr:host-nuclease inhibitor Gam family protein [Acetatifactor muris]MCM1561579.1 host-nuclease inhibitor Gam family protein [Butyrivibrio sp.]
MRKRVTDQVLQSWDDVNEALKSIGRADSAIAAIEARMNEEIVRIKTEAKAQTKAHEETKKLQEMLIQQYVSAHKSELKGKSHKLAHGTVGFRLSTKLVLPKEIKPIIEALKRNGMMDCLNQSVTVNKDVLKTYAEEQIIEVGGSLKKEDTFWYEVDRDSVQDK